MRRALLIVLAAWPARAGDVLGIGYVLDNPLPVLSGVADAGFSETVGIGAAWLAFDNEQALLQALQQGDVSIATGLSPEAFLDGISAGLDLRLADIAAVFSGQWQCFLRSDIAESKAALFGLKAALPYGTGAELVLDMQFAALGADARSLVRRDLAPVDAAAALARGDTDIACGDGEALVRMAENGAELLDVATTFALGSRGFSAVAVTGAFLADRPGAVEAFVNGQSALSGDLAAIAAAAGMGEIDAEAGLAGQMSLSQADKLGPDWLGGGIGSYLTDLARLRAERGMFVGDVAAISARIETGVLAGSLP